MRLTFFPFFSLYDLLTHIIRRNLLMKFKGCIALLLLASVAAWPADKKITVAELKSMLQSMHEQKKTDAKLPMRSSRCS